MTMTKLRLVLVDDHQLFREGLGALLASHDDLEIVGEASDAASAYETVEATDPDVVLVDIALPGTNGVAVVRELRRRSPGRRILVLTMHAEEHFVCQALSAGALGYAIKQQTADELLAAIRVVGGHQRYLAPRFSQEAIDELRRGRGGADGRAPLAILSPRESQIFDLLVRGYTNQSVAAHLSISAKTVETHRAHIFSKLGLHSIVELTRFAARHGLLGDFGDGVARAGAAPAKLSGGG